MMINKKTQQDFLLKLVNDATSPLLSEPNWAANLELVDAANNVKSPIRLSKLVGALRKKLLQKQHRIVMFTLTLIETLMNNGTSNIHFAFSNEKFMGTMVKLVKRGNNTKGKNERDAIEKQTKCLELIQCWGQAFLAKQAIGKVFVETYHHLRKKGKYHFPPQSLKNPIFDDENSPAKGSQRKTIASSHLPSAMPFEVNSSQTGKSMEQYLKEMEEDRDRLKKHLYSLKKNEVLSENDEINALACKCAAHSDQLTQMIEKMTDSEKLMPLLELNDSLQFVTSKYEKLILEEVCVDEDDDNESVRTEGFGSSKMKKYQSSGFESQLGEQKTVNEDTTTIESKTEHEGDLLLLGSPLKENNNIVSNSNPFNDPLNYLLPDEKPSNNSSPNVQFGGPQPFPQHPGVPVNVSYSSVPPHSGIPAKTSSYSSFKQNVPATLGNQDFRDPFNNGPALPYHPSSVSNHNNLQSVAQPLVNPNSRDVDLDDPFAGLSLQEPSTVGPVSVPGQQVPHTYQNSTVGNGNMYQGAGMVPSMQMKMQRPTAPQPFFPQQTQNPAKPRNVYRPPPPQHISQPVTGHLDDFLQPNQFQRPASVGPPLGLQQRASSDAVNPFQSFPPTSNHYEVHSGNNTSRVQQQSNRNSLDDLNPFDMNPTGHSQQHMYAPAVSNSNPFDSL